MSIISELRKLGRQRNGLQSLEEYYRQIDADKNDRGAAILAATFLEKALEYAVNRRLPNVTASNFKNLFENERAPLATLDAKILIADSLGMLGQQTLSNINIIKHVRNTFAHAVLPIDFSTKQVKDACEVLVIPKDPETFRKKLKFSTPRERFTTICEVTSVLLVTYALRCIQIRAAALEPETAIPMPLAPLP